MTFKKIVEYIGGRMTDLLFPPRCPICGRIIDAGLLICGKCEKTLPWIREPRCKICGKWLADERKELCTGCTERTHRFECGQCTFLYEGKLRQALMRLKFGNHREYAAFFGAAMAHGQKRFLDKIRPSVIIPVPMHEKKRRARGFDQCRLLADALSKETGIPVVTNCLIRNRSTKAQKGLDLKSRMANLSGAFSVNDPSPLSGTILLLDDIYTTGATMDEAAGTLRRAGAKKIFFIALCTGKGK